MTREKMNMFLNLLLRWTNHCTAAQNMSTTHFTSACTGIPYDLRARLASLRGIREMGKVGNIYWMDTCRDIMGIIEHDGALWWKKDEGRLWSRAGNNNDNTMVGVVVGPTTTAAGATTPEVSKDT
jgi:hypothetical protein